MPSIMTARLSTTAFAVLSSTALVALPALAQSTEDLTELPAIVITAAGFEQNVKDAPASVSVISGDDLRRTNVTSLSDALSQVQGVVTTGISAEQDILVRGMPGNYTLILVDGKRQGTRESRPNGNSGYEQSFIPPMAAIERIEVVRGPMSSLYGSDAMGGVINIITKPVSPVWTGSVTVEGTTPEHGADAGSTQQSFYLSGPLAGERLGLQLWGRAYQRGESQKQDGGQKADETDLTARVSWLATETQEFAFEMGTTDVSREASGGASLAAGTADTRQRNSREHWALSHKGDWGPTQTEANLTWERGTRESWSETGGRLVRAERAPEIENTVFDIKATTPFDFAGGHRLVYGGQYQRAELRDQNPGLGTAIETFAADQWALFVEDEWQIADDFALTLGLRHNEHEAFGGHVTPRIYGVWTASPDLTVKGGISTGYKTPELRSIVDGYYYSTERGAGVIVSNPDLKPEESLNYELGTIWDRGNFEIGATLYRTEFKNKIESYKTGDTIIVGGVSKNRWDYRNVAEATNQGIELTGRFDLGESLRLTANYTYTDSRQETGDYKGLPLTRTPEHMASLRLDWMTPLDGLDAWTAATYHGDEINGGARIGTNGKPYAYNAAGTPIAYKYEGYTTVDLGASYQIREGYQLNGAIYNLFDKETTASESNAVNEGRRLWLGLTANF